LEAQGIPTSTGQNWRRYTELQKGISNLALLQTTPQAALGSAKLNSYELFPTLLDHTGTTVTEAANIATYETLRIVSEVQQTISNKNTL